MCRAFQPIAYAFPFKPWEIIDAFEGTKCVGSHESSIFSVDLSEETELIKIYTLLVRAKEAGYLKMAIRRFNLAHQRERIEDSWIDLFVSLESLFSTASEMTEITHRLATRMSRASAVITLEDRKLLRGKIKKWYSFRSKIVHGQKAEFDEIDLKDIVRKSLL